MRYITNTAIATAFFLLSGFLVGKSGKNQQNQTLYTALYDAGRIVGEVFSYHREQQAVNEIPWRIFYYDANGNKIYVPVDDTELDIRLRESEIEFLRITF